MKARPIHKRDANRILPMKKGYKEVTGNFEILYGDDVFLKDPQGKWYFYDTAYGWAGDNSINFAKSHNGHVRYARKA